VSKAEVSQSLNESLKDKRLNFLRELASSLSPQDVLQIERKGVIHVGDHKMAGWKRPLSFYAFRCDKHGLVANYPIGHMEKLLCPFCLEEE